MKKLLKSLTTFCLSMSTCFVMAQTFSSSSNLTVQPITDRNVPFDLSEKGIVREVEWGTDLAWAHEQNLRRCVLFMGKENVEVARASFQPTYALVNGDLQRQQKNAVNNRLRLLKYCKPDVKLMLNCDHPSVDAYYKGNPQNWAALIDVTTKYFQDAGYEVVSVAPFNEPDYTATGQGNINDFYNICVELRKNSRFDNIRLCGGNTLNCDQAYPWYNTLKEYLDEGNTHQLAGSFNNFAFFFSTVRKDGKHATDDEMHNVMEAMVGLEYGLQTGIWWGPAEYARGEFCKASHGERMGYAEHRDNWTAASVYRAPDGKVQAFAGTSERQAIATSYKFISKDRDVFFNGHGPQREYVVDLPGGTGYQQGQTNAECVVNITWGDDVQPVIDGTYMLVNKSQPTKVIDIVNNNVQTNNYTAGSKTQEWLVSPIDPLKNSDFSYYYIFSANDKRTLDVNNWSLENHADVIIWGTDSSSANQQWYLEYENDGWFYIRHRHSSHCLELNGNNVVQGTMANGEEQLWRFVPTGSRPKISNHTAPTGLMAVTRPTSILLTWTPSEGDGPTYSILRAEQEDGEYEIIGRDVTDTAFVDNEVVNGKDYYYRIKMVDMYHNSSPVSNTVTAASTGENELVARYEFEENTKDSTYNINNGAVLTQDYIDGTSGNYAFNLDGYTNFVQLPTAIANHRNMTIASWIYWRGGDQWQHLFDFGNDENEYMYLTVRSDESNKVKFAIKNGEEEQFLTANKTLTSVRNKWAHLALSMGEDSVAIYLNGELIGSSKDITIRPSDFQPIMNYIGRSQFANHPTFKGRIDDFRIYNYALSKKEIQQLVNDVTGINEPIAKNMGIHIQSTLIGQELVVDFSTGNGTDGIHLQIFNTQGALLRDINTTKQESTRINVSDFPNGLYILKATSGKETGTRKFTVHRR
ncbi:MAG: RICIN domain-containing protein [Paraprevotella sp.]|nr:RICIN domain-containing protein [Paraprevotella sp.]